MFWVRIQKDDASTYGGYQLDSADAAGTQGALTQKQDLLRRPGEAGDQLRGFQAQQEADIAAKADELAARTGGDFGTETEAAEALAVALRDARSFDLAEVDDAYEVWRTAHGDGVLFDGEPLAQSLRQLADDLPEGFAATRGKVRRILNKYNLTTLAGKAEPFDLNASEKLIQEFNSLYEPGKSAQNRAVSEMKQAVDTFVDESLADLNIPAGHPAYLGRLARQKRREFAQKWETGDLVDKLTSKKPGTDEYRMQPLQAARQLARAQNTKALADVKFKLSAIGTPEDQQVWSNISQGPILEAIDAATRQSSRVAEGGQQLFDGEAFERVIKRYSPETRSLLWGPDLEREVQGAISAWKLRGKRVLVRGTDNPSGTANVLLRLMGQGKLKRLSESAPILSDVVEKLRDGKAKREAQRLISGDITEQVLRDRQRQVKAELLELYRGTDLLKFDHALNYLSRAVARELLANDSNE
ncbi:MAG: hypothetical protein AAGF57_07595 [Pseudomonadota bacterium]